MDLAGIRAGTMPPVPPAPPTVSQASWDDKLNAAELSKADLNAIIFDYLIVEGFSDAAVEFARETGLALSVDQDQIQERMDIRQAVEDGRVEEAVRRVNELDPEILDTNPPLLFHLHLLRLIELIRAERTDDALTFATLELAPRGAQNPEFLADLERTMALLAFPHLAAYADDTPAAGPAAASASAPGTGMAATPLPSGPATPAPGAAAASRAPGKTAAADTDAFRDPVFAPIVQLMKRAQRVKVAKELNAAILEAQGQGMETKLSGLVRLMSWGEERLDRAGVGLPAEERERGRRWADAVLKDELAL